MSTLLSVSFLRVVERVEERGGRGRGCSGSSAWKAARAKRPSRDDVVPGAGEGEEEEEEDDDVVVGGGTVVVGGAVLAGDGRLRGGRERDSKGRDFLRGASTEELGEE